jgi:hypothetical protein
MSAKNQYKLLAVTFDASLEDQLNKVLDKAGIDNFVKSNGYLGKMRTCRLMDDHVWPGHFMRYLVQVSTAQLEDLRPLLTELSEQFCEEGFRVLVIPVEEII